jgi:hypothetical protein
MRRGYTRWSVLALLALGLGLQGTAFVERASACHSILEAADPSGCCKRPGPIVLQKEGGDCCQTLDVSPADPAGSSSRLDETAPAHVAVAPRPVLRLPAPRAVHVPWRAALERGPPYPPATQNIVLLN